jgi:hypothetical protein
MTTKIAVQIGGDARLFGRAGGGHLPAPDAQLAYGGRDWPAWR